MVRNSGWFFLLVFSAGMLGGCVGCVVGNDRFWRAPTSPEVLPLPHHISKYPDGLSLRFAMVHDMIHERFPKHGRAYYEERNRIVQQELLASRGRQPPEDAKEQKRYFELLDDLGAGLERLGQHEEAVELMRRKLREQLDLKMSGRELYGAYANLGTFLILWQLNEGFADKEKAKARLEEGLGYVKKSIELNPEAHFGREIWQAVILEFLIAALDNPDLILKYDFIGNRLDANIDPRTSRSYDANSWSHIARYAERNSNNKEHRNLITKVGAEEGWCDVKTSQPLPTPFDEPSLAIIGMWRLGSGANPYFALAFGEIMLRVGQRYIAWTAYERAAQMAGGIWPDQKIQEGILAHCRRRQQVIEEQLPSDEIPHLRPRFEKELAFGHRYQKEYQAYEADQIAKEVSIDDPKFYNGFDFEARHGKIASPIGEEDRFMVEGRHPWPYISWPAIFFFAGLFALGMAVMVMAWQWLVPPAEPARTSARPNPFEESGEPA